jgi:hypothetical protein
VLLYLDELTSYRHPSVACAYEEARTARPHAERSLASNTVTRVVGTLEALSGRVLLRSGYNEVMLYELPSCHGLYPSVRRSSRSIPRSSASMR